MILLYLILSHLIGDFVLQPNKLVHWKIKSKKGAFVHVLIHFIVNLLIFLPFLIKGYLWLIVVFFFMSFIHFWIDEVKIKYDLKYDKKVKAFILDQFLHLLIVFIAYIAIRYIYF
jgi:hypothetical protein